MTNTYDYLDEYNMKLKDLNAVNQQEQLDYAKYLDRLGQFNTDRGFAYQNYADDYDRLRSQLADVQGQDQIDYARYLDEASRQQTAQDSIRSQVDAILAAGGSPSANLVSESGYSSEYVKALEDAYRKQEAEKAAKKSGSGGGGSSDFGSTLPAPELELVGKRDANALGGLYLCLRNKGDYNPYVMGYTVVLKVFRYRKRAKHRKRSGSTKVYYMKEGWHQPSAGLAPWNVNDPNPIPSRLDLAELREVDIVTSGGFSYSRKDVICEVSSIVQALWYDIETGTKYHVATTSNAYHIRVTGSKNLKASKRGRWGKIAKNNFLKIAFRVYVYSGNSLVAKSPIGDALVLTPQLGGNSACPMRARIE